MIKSLIKNVFFLSLIFVFSSLKNSNTSGIQFTEQSFTKAKETAAKTGQLIFIDVYASWCGPCKLMSARSFPDKQVGEKYNKSFISLKLDAEKSQDGQDVARMYGVTAYPTLLFVDSKGKLIRKFVGYRTPEELIQVADFVLK
ncbi:MAG: thioredoxin family protein [Bacteroidetes bacterium]|nr:thioredoxin family protein [Bacteroidota bacterium]